MKQARFLPYVLIGLTITMILLCALLFPGKTAAATYGDFTYVVKNGSAVITEYTGSATVVTVPSTVDGYAVIGVEDAFFWNGEITSVTLPEGITYIGRSAFDFCEKLTSVNIPSTVTEIKEGAFSCCFSLKTVTLPEGLTTIEDLAFDCCERLQAIEFPSTLKSIGDLAFRGCSSLKTVTVPAQAELGYAAFSGCTGITSAIIKANIKTLPEEIFCGCSSLKEVQLPESLTKIEDYAFYACTSLTSITLPKNVKTISVETFTDCTRLASIYFECTSMSGLPNLSFSGASLPTLEGGVPSGIVGYVPFRSSGDWKGIPLRSYCPNEHTYSAWTTKTKATCAQPGIKEQVCAVCDHKNTETIAKTDHDFGEWTVIKAPTADENGQQKRTCSHCNYTETEVLPSLSSTETTPSGTAQPSTTDAPANGTDAKGSGSAGKPNAGVIWLIAGTSFGVIAMATGILLSLFYKKKRA